LYPWFFGNIGHEAGAGTRLLTGMATVYGDYGPFPHGEGPILIGET